MNKNWDSTEVSKIDCLLRHTTARNFSINKSERKVHFFFVCSCWCTSGSPAVQCNGSLWVGRTASTASHESPIRLGGLALGSLSYSSVWACWDTSRPWRGRSGQPETFRPALTAPGGGHRRAPVNDRGVVAVRRSNLALTTVKSEDEKTVRMVRTGSRDTGGLRQKPGEAKEGKQKERDKVPDVKEGMKDKMNVKDVRVTKARWRGRAVEGKEERMERRRVERRLDGQDSKDAASQLRTSRWIRKPEGRMRDETRGGASGIKEQKKREGAFDTRVCHIDPRYRKHPISNSEIKTCTSRQQKTKRWNLCLWASTGGESDAPARRLWISGQRCLPLQLH